MLDGAPTTDFSLKVLRLADQILKFVPASTGPKAIKYGAVLYRARYTIPAGALVDKAVAASALWALPVGAGNARLPLVILQHTTTTHRNEVPSRGRPNPEALAAATLASLGFAVVAPDYLGLGDSPGPHPYLDSLLEGVATVGAIRDFKESPLAAQVDFGRTWILGYSQGGHATLAAHRMLELLEEKTGVHVVASIPMAGPLAIDQLALTPTIAEETSPARILYACYLLYAAVRAPDSGLKMSDVFTPEYATQVALWFNGRHSLSALIKAMPPRLDAVIRRDMITAAKDQPSHPLRAKLAEMNVLDGWVPRGAVHLLHASGDRVVEYHHSELALWTLHKVGAPHVTLTDLGDTLDHDAAAIPAFRKALELLTSVVN